MIISEREPPGYPGVRVELHSDLNGNSSVEIHDEFGRVTWKAKDRAEARDMYFHTFAFGYTAPCDTPRETTNE
jgi:hypothetical protein